MYNMYNGEKKIDRVLLYLILLYYAKCDTVPLMMGKVLYNVHKVYGTKK